ncbi:hypothetical protein AXG93_3893s1410 [Marchantia polymorpha subsp. ruderalis]|uniref:Fe2OG dioxygenase domain-containing protein n=1 Tax=Marchantia polymorpha subsp. ruderalis TaxID=1480154 RepID=A0A176WBM4_MARPO|nr:hypothetical protein AXG93_3893s1410 [Marchantia polymorpha subsp. ruderalis]
MVARTAGSDTASEEVTVEGIRCPEQRSSESRRPDSKCNYVYEGRDFYPMPVVDLHGLEVEDPQIRASVLRELKEAAKVGCFTTVNHGIDPKVLLQLRENSNAFFSLPSEDKAKCAQVRGTGALRAVGYQTQFQGLTEKASTVPRREVFEIQGCPLEGRDSVPWPQSSPSFRESLETFAEEICKLSTWVCESLAEALGLSRDAFIKQLGGGVHQQVVASSYPVPENQPKDTPSSVGFGAHTDLTVINAVVEDENGGAQVWHDDQWMNKRPISAGVSFFLGDPIECMSNGIYHSIVHRVIAPCNNSRFSCVTTLEPVDKDATVLQPVPELVARSGQPAKYVAYNFGGRGKSVMSQRFDPDILTKRFMVTDFSVIDPLRNFSYRDGVFYIGSRPLGSLTEESPSGGKEAFLRCRSAALWRL